MNKNNTQRKDIYCAVEYAGFWHIQTGPYYGDTDILNADDVGEDRAEKNANLIAKLLNNHSAVAIPLDSKEPEDKVLDKLYLLQRSITAARPDEDSIIKDLKKQIDKIIKLYKLKTLKP